MTAPPAMLFAWDDDRKVMVPLSAARASAAFVHGETYRLETREERSEKSHDHYFAAVASAWENLPEGAAERFPSSEHLRKWCLIKAGYRDERTVVCGSKADAQRVALWGKQFDDHAVVVARGNVVIAWTAQSQSMKAMGRKRFQESKDAVLRVLAELLGTNAHVLEANAGKAA